MPVRDISAPPKSGKRKAVSVKTRFEIFKRDFFTCQYCGATPPAAILEVDHILAVASGGTNAQDNLVTSCWTCNRGKGARSLTAVPASLADRAATVAEQERQIAGYAAAVAERQQRIDRDAWLVVRALFGTDKISQDWFRSIVMFLGKLPLHEIIDAANRAQSGRRRERDTFLYFCGVCWKKIKGTVA